MLKNFKTIAKNCINGKIKGIFILATGSEVPSDALKNNYNPATNKEYPFAFYDGYNIILTNNGKNHRYSHSVSMFDVVDFKKID